MSGSKFSGRFTRLPLFVRVCLSAGGASLLGVAIGDGSPLAFAAQPAAKNKKGSTVMPKPAQAKPVFVSAATAFVDLLVAGKFEQATSYLDPSIKSQLPAPKMQLAWQAVAMQYGPYKKRQAPRTESLGPYSMVIFPVVFGNDLIDLRIAFLDKPKVTGFFMEPGRGGYREAAYVKRQMFREIKAKIGSGKWQLDGVLTVPNGEGPFPAVILVHGSGPQDMDESIGPNKPFRDLACGLASKGVAVLRYEKRTKQHGKQITGEEFKNFTVKEETIDDAVAAARLLRAIAEIDKNAIVVLGHSLGGTVVPRIASADPQINGFIIMAGLNEPIEDAMVRQSEYIAGLGGADGAEITKQLETMKAQAEKVKALSDADVSSGSILMGASPAYWLDFKAHDPLAEIKDVNSPMLFLQGGRDYQVTADGDFARWKEAVKAAGKEGQSQFKLYPQLNHLFITGKGKATPEEYTRKTGNVDEAVLTDISTWVKNLGKSG